MFPTKHRYGALIGGWWYSAKEGKELIGVPNKIKGLLPYEMKRNKKSNSILDLESIRLLGRCILGDKNGNLLSVGGNVPNTLNLWLKANAGNNPFEEYSIWSNIMNCIGERKFIKNL